jgi:SAF domain
MRTRSQIMLTNDAPRFVGKGHRRRPALAMASIALVMFCIATFSSLYLHAGNRVAVLATSHDIPQGHTINRGDLEVVRVSLSEGLAPISAQDSSKIVGRIATVPLLRGTLLSKSELAVHGGPARGKAVVGVATKAGQLPAGGVAVGDTVDVILTGSPALLAGGTSGSSNSTNSAATTGQVEIGGVLASNATVTGVAVPTSSSPDTIVVSVLIPISMAPLVASASAAGQAALVLVG